MSTPPVASGIVPGLNQPGGNITGFGGVEPSSITLSGRPLRLEDARNCVSTSRGILNVAPAPTVPQPAPHVRAHARLADNDMLAAATCRVPAPISSPLLPRCFPATTGHAPCSSSGLPASWL